MSGQIAQLVEHRTENPGVVSSILTLPIRVSRCHRSLKLRCEQTSGSRSSDPTTCGWCQSCQQPYHPETRPARVAQSSLPDALDIASRFEDLKKLKDGWLDGAGRAPSHEGLDWLARVLKDRYPDYLPRPYAYPVPDGGIQLEWSIKRQEISLEVDFESRTRGLAFS